MILTYIAAILPFLFIFVSTKTTERWNSYKEKHNKAYSHPHVEQARRKIWEDNYDYVDLHNADFLQGKKRYSLGQNIFSDWGPVERETVKGLKVSATVRNESTEQQLAARSLPSSIDYSSSPCMVPVLDQGLCGSCWAFTAASLVDYYKCRRSNVRTLYSRQQLVSCDTSDGGCGGGFYVNAWKWTLDSGGSCTNKDYPYTSNLTKASNTCYSNCTKQKTVTSHKWVTATSSAIVNALASVGPVAAAIYSNDPFMFYESGIYEDIDCKKTPNHAILITGYGKSALGIDYWTIQNSWGTSWGMEGYGQIRRGVNMCGIESYVAYPVV